MPKSTLDFKKIMENKTNKKTIEEVYQKKTPIEHILTRPDTYIGSIEKETQQMYVWNDSTKKIELKSITYVPGLYKIFDEILVNAADNSIRDSKMDTIRISIQDNTISVYNNGRGIPVRMHEKEKVYVPEMIFGQLLTSSNYDDSEKKVTGGRNGYGAKLCNIFSTEFVVETADRTAKAHYYQRYTNNMSHREDPVISKYSKEDFTRITFKPDLKKFNMQSLDEDTVSLLKKRVYDLAGILKAKVFLNEERINVKGLKQYASLYLPEDASVVYERISERWEVAFTLSDEQFQQVSFVNAVCTSKGGTHVTHVVDQLVDPLAELAKKKEKGAVIKPFQVKAGMFLFINCLVENPTFDSQTKELLTLRASSFGSKCTPLDSFIRAVSKTGIVERIAASARLRQGQQLKKTDGAKTSRLSGISKLDDAAKAGTKDSQRCTLILTEGDSAKTLAISGLSVVGREHYGVFPLRGKLLNVREATHKQIMENSEISNIKKILGLQHGKEYTGTESLRYGHLMIMADQDHDGSHIKGLIINLFDHFFPSLLGVPGFLQEFITPIVRATRGKEVIDFFTLPEYEAWRASMCGAVGGGDGTVGGLSGDPNLDPNLNLHPHSNTHPPTHPPTHPLSSYKIKYYKGLGTSKAEDARQYFGNLQRHVKSFAPLSPTDREAIDLAFNKKKADSRKEWLRAVEPGTFLDNARSSEISITDFVNKELVLFSMADNVRSIPSVVDGLKPGQRKVMFVCFLRNLKEEIKVSSLAGSVAEKAAYHHGEQSLCATIVNLAQNFVGSNNVNLLVPSGQFGTRLQGGKDAASARYIHTQLSQLARVIFHEHDDALLSYLSDDNLSIEPAWYVPVVPLVLLNGAEGIGTGWSTSIPGFDPHDVVDNLRALLEGREMKDMQPFYRGFNGSVEEIGAQRYKVSGVYAVDGEGEGVRGRGVRGGVQGRGSSGTGSSGTGSSGTGSRSSGTTSTSGRSTTATSNTTRSSNTTSTPSHTSSHATPSHTSITVTVTELPVGVWTQSYKEFLETLLESGELRDFKEYHTEKRVHFELLFKEDKFRLFEGSLEKKLKLSTTVSLNNMVCFDPKGVIKRYSCVLEILRDFYAVRMEFYNLRKMHRLKVLREELSRLMNRVRFIKEVVEGVLIISKRKKDAVVGDLEVRGYEKIGGNYDYLLSMQLLSLTYERIEKLEEERRMKQEEYDVLDRKTLKMLWEEDLDAFVEVYDRFCKAEEEDDVGKGKKGKGAKGRRVVAKDKSTGAKDSKDGKGKDGKDGSGDGAKRVRKDKPWEKYNVICSDDE